MEDPEIFSDDYWNKRYLEHNTPWDMGHTSPPLTTFLEQLKDKETRILIPGGGNSYEAEWLWNRGFYNTHVVELAQEALNHLLARVPEFNRENLIHADFFDLDQSFDLVVEQTFFCALDPSWREDYVKKMHEILNPGGELFGVLFDFPLTEEGPPFGGSMREYQGLFEKYFTIHKLERCYNSIKPRMGNELFFRLSKEG